MIKLRNLFALASAVISVLSGKVNENLNKNDEFVFYISPFSGKKDDFDTIKWFERENEYYMFLPSNTNRNELTVYFDGAEVIKVDNTNLKNGDSTNIFSYKNSYRVSVDNKTFKLNFLESENIPSMFLETKKPLEYINADKNNKTEAKIKTYEDGELTLDSSLKQIKGRGNSTWNYDKKAYNIKFDKKTSLLGMPKAKKWTLLASYIDPILIKNPLGWELSNLMGIDYTSEYNFIDLYVNNEYLGNYIVCEPVEIGDKRIDIYDLSKATEDLNEGKDLEEFDIEKSVSDIDYSKKQWVNIPNNPSDISGGYLLECEFSHRVDQEVSYFTTKRNQTMVIKEPEYASKEQVDFISSYFQEAEDAISNETGFNSLGKHFTEYFDIDSIVNAYILLEISENSDGGKSSTFFYKDKGEKIHAGPIWDNDTAFGNLGIAEGILIADPSKWIINEAYYTSNSNNSAFPTIYNRLFKLKYFRDKVSKKWTSIKKIVTKNVVTKLINDLSAKVRKSGIMNACRWYGISDIETFNFITNITKKNLINRISNLNIGFSKLAAHLFYDVNGGKGFCSEKNILLDGQFAYVNGPYYYNMKNINKIKDLNNIFDYIVNKILPPSDDLTFAGWNTKRDGSGKTYLPGDSILMLGTKTLYAQWKPKTENEPDYYKPIWFDNPINEFVESLLKVLEMLILK